ncbi:TPA: hypothetical protein ACJUE4_002874 [Listeria monocytogenes]|uniref:Uncharacterized protein n=1 Tax=Vagococcus fluvialis bH819 TaxID=1255619 RepID=A0A1X6WRY1_9ENTE|nr:MULTISPECIES: hypothetical protein [Vagococcus]MDT2832103.1 hypothetical protein [Vagococcus carniphilus]MDT2840937.1 hypothetical protein [Vagococcus carniphilus]MDT2855548.1 hypothetical protein [Vagococcus carniphilus]SLM87027.1 hypothetical protein FM121_13095 [Vagococcus fluvialis bH819]
MYKELLLALVVFIYDEEYEMSWFYRNVILKETQTTRERKIVYELTNDL